VEEQNGTLTKTRIQFTRKELELLNSMCAIASAARWGEGDYAGDEWESLNTEKVFDSARGKLWDLLARKNKGIRGEHGSNNG
jgi:hypothetical protein